MKALRLIIVIILSMGFSHASCAEEVVRLTTTEWAPYFSKSLTYGGIGSRIVSEAFALEGITVQYTYFPAKRGLIVAQQGEYDGAVTWQSNPERERDFYASDVIFEAPWVFFHLKTFAFDWETLADLKNLTIGGTIEYMYSEEFLNAEKSGAIRVERVVKDEQNFKKLVSGRIDVFPQLQDIGYYQLHEIFDPSVINLITHHPRPLAVHKDQLLISKKNPKGQELMMRFNRGLQKLKDSGKYDEYFNAFRKGEY